MVSKEVHPWSPPTGHQKLGKRKAGKEKCTIGLKVPCVRSVSGDQSWPRTTTEIAISHLLPSTYGLETHGCFLDYQPVPAAHLPAGTLNGWERCSQEALCCSL